ncbi:MAG: tetratricopeptide repeat protein [Acidobacteriia bacterium]|nr:tetratricopeptide repeat protein [Terriglobia bacterium]
MRTKLWTAVWLVATISSVACGKSARQYVDRGNQLFAAGKYEDASINYRNAIKKDSTFGEAQYRLALALLKQNKAGEAYQALNRAVDLSPQNVPAKVELASLSLAAYAQDPSRPAALYNRAATLTDQLLAANPNLVDGLRLKGTIAMLDRRLGDAITAFRRALELSSGAPEIHTALVEALLRDNQPEEGEREAKQIIARHPQFGPAYDLLYAQYLLGKRWTEAESLLKLRMANNPKDPAAVLQLAGFYFGRQNPDEAEKLINSLLARRDTFPQADLLAGDFHTLTRAWDKALEDYQRGLSRDKARETTYRERSATVLAILGRRDEALKTLDAVLAKDPKDQNARALKISVLIEMGGAQNLSNAALLAADLAKDAPANPRIQMLTGQAALAKGELDVATARFQQAARADRRTPAPHLALARVYLLRKNYAAVLEQADAALAINRNDENARLLRITALTLTASYGQAKSEAEQLARESSHPRQAQMQLGIIALAQKHYGEAETYFQKLNKENSGDLHPLAGLVSTYLAQSLPDRALDLLEAEKKRAPESLGTEALIVSTAEASGKFDLALSELAEMAAKSPNSAEVQIRIAELQKKQGHAAAALEALQRARQLDPKRRGLDAAMANLQEEMGKKTEAVASYRKALSETPDNPVVLNNLAYLLTETGGDLEEALRLVTQGVRKAPGNPNLQDTLAWVQLKKGNASAALPILSSITQKYPDDATFRYHYAAALLRSGDRTEARQQLQTALSKQPAQPLEQEIRTLLAQAQ